MPYSKWILCLILHYLNTVKALEFNHNHPRITLSAKDASFWRHSRKGSHTRAELLQGPRVNSIYVGGHRKLFLMDFQNSSRSKEVTMFENECRNHKLPGICEYDITMVHAVKGGSSLFVCGTNGIQPVCCYMTLSKDGFGPCSVELAEGIAPFYVKEKAPSLYIGDELYTTANLYVQGDGVGIRRHYGKRGRISSSANKTEQRFVGLAVSGPRADPLQDRLYGFVVERSMDQHPEADPWISRVIQVCKADSGGTKSILERLWTSRLSTRLYCGITEKKLHFSYLLDVTVLHADSWKDSRVYALFTNGWGMRAVCVYTMGAIDQVFMNSDFKNSVGSVSKNRPRMCVENSKALPREVLRQMKDYQEMEDWVRPLKDHAPFLVSHRHYRHIRADKVTGRGLTQHTVLFLSLDSGAVHKVLEQADHPFIIAELRPFRNKTHIQNMLLQSSAKKLYVSSSTEVVELDLYDCQSYGHWCEECVKARDPYCGWDGTKCTAASGDEIQDIEHGNYTVCEGAGKNRKYTPPREVYSVSPSAKFFLQCPMLSSHALYSWHHKGRLIECLIVERQCLLLIENMSTELQGNYSCVASEGGYERTQVQYELRTEGKARRLASSLSIFMCLLVTQTLLI